MSTWGILNASTTRKIVSALLKRRIFCHKIKITKPFCDYFIRVNVIEFLKKKNPLGEKKNALN
jgi:hypothetical protein